MDFFDNTDNITGLHTDECGGRQLDFGTCDKRGTGRWGFPEAVCQSAVLMDGDTGRILYGKGQDIIRPMASTTKIMTCILALENGRGEDAVKASSNAASQPKVHLGCGKERSTGWRTCCMPDAGIL